MILAKFPEDLDAPIIKFNGQFYFFEGPWLKWVDDEILADELCTMFKKNSNGTIPANAGIVYILMNNNTPIIKHDQLPLRLL